MLARKSVVQNISESIKELLKNEFRRMVELEVSDREFALWRSFYELKNFFLEITDEADGSLDINW